MTPAVGRTPPGQVHLPVGSCIRRDALITPDAHENGYPDDAHLALADALLNRLRGRMTVVQTPEERYALAANVLADLTRHHHQNGLPELTTDAARRAFLEAFLRYDLLEGFLADPSVEDIMINATDTIFVHKTGEGLVKTEERFATHRELEVFVKKLVVFGGRSEVDPINNLELYQIRGRVNIIHSPFGPQITITRGKPAPLTILQLIEHGSLSYEIAAQLWMYVEGLRVRPANLIIAGGPGAGKTTLLNALLSFIPPRERVVTIEDTLELNTAFLENCARLESCRRVKTAELVKNSLRMRPERILVGEVRGIEANDLMTAVNLGKYCMGTIHASSARETILRLEHEPMNVPPVLISLVDAFVILRKRNVGDTIARVVHEIVETAGMERDTVLLSSVWTFNHQRRETVESMPSSAYRDRLALESGRGAAQIMEETARRARILKAMQESGRFGEIDAVTRFCQCYCAYPEEALRQLKISEGVERKR